MAPSRLPPSNLIEAAGPALVVVCHRHREIRQLGVGNPRASGGRRRLSRSMIGRRSACFPNERRLDIGRFRLSACRLERRSPTISTPSPGCRAIRCPKEEPDGIRPVPRAAGGAAGQDANVRPPLRLVGRGVAGDRLVRATAGRRARPRGAGDHGGRSGRGVQAFRDGSGGAAAQDAALRRIAEGVLFREGDIVEHGERAEAESEKDGGEPTAPVPADCSLGVGGLRGAGR